MRISPFTPLVFRSQNEKKQSDGAESCYVQTFAKTDQILVEAFVAANETAPEFFLSDYNQQTSLPITASVWTLEGGIKIYFFTLQGLDDGTYMIYLPSYELESNKFRVTSNKAELDSTVLLQYANKDNTQRDDAAFIISGMRYFFDFRVPGGFKDGETSYSCETEQFTTQHGDIRQLYALDTTQRRLTIGCAEGVPAWFGEMLNRALCCSYFYIDGKRYARKDASVPEISQQVEGVDSFIFKQSLQRVMRLDPTIESGNKVVLRRADATQYRSASIGETTYNLIIE